MSADHKCGGEKTHMPNAKVLSEKQAIVEALVERINGASAGIFVDYQGITVAEDTALRTEMRKEGVDYTVVKNTLTRIAIDKVGMNELDPILNGRLSERHNGRSGSMPDGSHRAERRRTRGRTRSSGMIRLPTKIKFGGKQ